MKIITETLRLIFSNINLLNKIFCVAQDTMAIKGFGIPIEMLMILMLHPSINK